MFGEGGSGQLGNSSFANEAVPVRIQVERGVNVKQVACGEKHTLLVLGDGRVFGSGFNEQGEISSSIKMRRVKSFTEIPELQSQFIVKVAASNFSAAIALSSTLFEWGNGLPSKAMRISGDPEKFILKIGKSFGIY